MHAFLEIDEGAAEVVDEIGLEIPSGPIGKILNAILATNKKKYWNMDSKLQ